VLLGVETPSRAYAIWGTDKDWSESLQDAIGGGWFLNNLRVIQYCVQHTTLCEMALAHPDDAVLPALVRLFRHQAGFEMNVTDDPDEIRRLVLIGIRDCLDGKLETGLKSTRPTSIVQRDIVHTGQEYDSDSEESLSEQDHQRRERIRMRRRISLKDMFWHRDEMSENSPAEESR
jgi:hypothetical protein